MPHKEMKLLLSLDCHSGRGWGFYFHRRIEWDALQLCWRRLRDENISCHFIPLGGASGVANDVTVLRDNDCNYIEFKRDHNTFFAVIRVAPDWLDDVIQLFEAQTWSPTVEFYLSAKKSKLRGSTRRGLSLCINHDASFMQDSRPRLSLDSYLSSYLLCFEGEARPE